jgi:predicted ester cyclase
MDSSKDLVRRFYSHCLTVSPGQDPTPVMEKLLAADFESIDAAQTKSKAQLIGQVQYFWKLVPDLAWTVEEVLQDGNRVVVRSTATGSPKGQFMGLDLDGSRSFRIMTIDIHTVEGQQIRRIHHLEEWMTAIKQLGG